MATALPESKSLQERINALHIQLTTANEEQQKGLLKLIDEDDVLRLSGSKCRDRQGQAFFDVCIIYDFSKKIVRQSSWFD